MKARNFAVRYVLVPLAWLCAWGSVDTFIKLAAGLLFLGWDPECWKQPDWPMGSGGFAAVYWLCMISFLAGVLVSRPLKSGFFWSLTAFWLYMGLAGLLGVGIFMVVGILWYDMSMDWSMGPTALLVALLVPCAVFLVLVPCTHYVLFYRWKPLGKALRAGTTSIRPAKP